VVSEDRRQTLKFMQKRYFSLKRGFLAILEEHTGKDRKTLKKDMERDFFMSAEEAVQYGLIDSVVKRK
jgi:ATP-dependent Clp protease, protease subunit